MTASRVAALAALAVLGCALSASAQGLGDTASKERKKRTEAKKPPARQYTNEDLEAGRPPGSKPSAGSEAGGTSAVETQPEVPSEPSRLEQERPYIEAIQAAEREVKAAEERIRELQGRLNPMSTTYIYGPSGSNDANEELRVRAELTEAEGQLQAARQAVVDANARLQDFRSGRSSSPLVER